MKGNLETLRKIVFEKQKVPYYNRKHGKLTIGTILNKEGLHTYIFRPGLHEHSLKSWNELTEEDVSLLIEKLPELVGVSK